jgi:hypothetical protein
MMHGPMALDDTSFPVGYTIQYYLFLELDLFQAQGQYMYRLYSSIVVCADYNTIVLALPSARNIPSNYRGLGIP